MSNMSQCFETTSLSRTAKNGTLDIFMTPISAKVRREINAAATGIVYVFFASLSLRQTEMEAVFDSNAFEEVSISEEVETVNETKEKPLIKQRTDDAAHSIEMDKKKHLYNIAVLIVCCLMLFGGSYSKATPKGI